MDCPDDFTPQQNEMFLPLRQDEDGIGNWFKCFDEQPVQKPGNFGFLRKRFKSAIPYRILIWFGNLGPSLYRCTSP